MGHLDAAVKLLVECEPEEENFLADQHLACLIATVAATGRSAPLLYYYRGGFCSIVMYVVNRPSGACSAFLHSRLLLLDKPANQIFKNVKSWFFPWK